MKLAAHFVAADGVTDSVVLDLDAASYAGQTLTFYVGGSVVATVEVPVEVTDDITATFDPVVIGTPVGDEYPTPTPLPTETPIASPTPTPGPDPGDIDGGSIAPPSGGSLPSYPTSGSFGGPGPNGTGIPTDWYSTLTSDMSKGDMAEAVQKGVEDGLPQGTPQGSGLDDLTAGSDDLNTKAQSTVAKFQTVVAKFGFLRDNMAFTINRMKPPNLSQVSSGMSISWGMGVTTTIPPAPGWLYNLFKLAILISAFFAVQTMIRDAYAD
jgi:hypothetical protein